MDSKNEDENKSDVVPETDVNQPGPPIEDISAPSDSQDVLSQDENMPSPSGEVDQSETESPTMSSQVTVAKKKFSWGIVSIVIAIIALLGVGTYFVLRVSDVEDTSQQEVVKNEIPLLRVSVQDGPLNLFYKEVQNDGALTVNNSIYEGLVGYEKVNKIVPLLATSWTNPDDETWIFKLKENVTFHSGKIMTAEDVKFSIEKPEIFEFGGFGTSIKTVEVVDASTIKIVTDGPDPLLLGSLAFIWITEATPEADAKYPAGTGPYMVKPDSTPTESVVDLVAFNNYHGGAIYTKELHFQQMTNEDAVKAFNDQKIDIASTLVSDSEDLNLPGQKLITIKDFTVTFLGLNPSEDSPLKELKVRQAIEKAVDPALVITAQGVVGEPENQLVTKYVPGYNPELTRPALDIAGAKQLLKEAGYENGFTIKLSYATVNNDGVYKSVKDQLAKIGITVEKDFYTEEEIDNFFDTFLSGKFELLFLAYAPDNLDASDTYRSLLSGKEAVIRNTAGVEIEDLLAKAGKTFNEAERLNVLKSISVIVQDAVAAIPLYSRDSITALNAPYVVERQLPTGSSGFRFNEVYLP